jgi:hypothetical protein
MTCVECGCETATRITVHKVGYLCFLCTDMLLTVYNSPFHVKAHAEYLGKVKQRKRLFPGADYFK